MKTSDKYSRHQREGGGKGRGRERGRKGEGERKREGERDGGKGERTNYQKEFLFFLSLLYLHSPNKGKCSVYGRHRPFLRGNYAGRQLHWCNKNRRDAIALPGHAAAPVPRPRAIIRSTYRLIVLALAIDHARASTRVSDREAYRDL